MKWRAFQRSLAVGHHPARSINALLGRLPITTPTPPAVKSIPQCRHWNPANRLLARSLVEWLHESGITLVRATALTPEQEETRARTVVTLSEVARKIHLWFDPEIHNPDLRLLALQCYVTDGSFSTPVENYFDILIPEDELRMKGTGAAAIVLISTARDRTPLPHTVRIIMNVSICLGTPCTTGGA